jgi:hypothetical protein
MILHIWNLRNKLKSNKREKTKKKLNLRLKSINPSKTLNISIIWETDQDLQIKESKLQSTLLSILKSKMTISFQSKLNIITNLLLFGVILHYLYYSRYIYFKSWTTSFSTFTWRNMFVFKYGATNQVISLQ